jgi:hypothetical protein
LFADDQQLYLHTSAGSPVAVNEQLSACVSDTRDWYANRRLQFSDNKTEVVWFESHAELSKLSIYDCILIVDGTAIQSPQVVRYLSVLFYSEMIMKPYITKIMRF